MRDSGLMRRRRRRRRRRGVAEIAQTRKHYEKAK
jgi:hypothetical protein